MAADHGHRKCGIAAAVHKSLALHIACLLYTSDAADE